MFVCIAYLEVGLILLLSRLLTISSINLMDPSTKAMDAESNNVVLSYASNSNLVDS